MYLNWLNAQRAWRRQNRRYARPADRRACGRAGYRLSIMGPTAPSPCGCF